MSLWFTIFAKVGTVAVCKRGNLPSESPGTNSILKSDVLARHIRQCIQSGQGNSGKAASQRPKQTRSKKACNRCAKSKLKCDSKQPCSNCRSKSHSCQYTREGYEDPYNSYRIARGKQNSTMIAVPARTSVSPPNSAVTPLDAASSLQEEDCSSLENVGDADEALVLDHQDPPSVEEAIMAQFSHENGGKTIGSGSALWDFAVDSGQWVNLNQHIVMTPPMTDDQGCRTVYPSGQVEQILSATSDSDFDTLLQSQCFSSIYSPTGPQGPMSAPNPPYFLDSEPLLTNNAFLLRQLDPVEAKCVELRQMAQTSLNGSTDTGFITRDSLIKCTELFAKHFSPNVPVLHLPTFSLVDTSPILLLAIMLVGACYSSNIPASTIHDYAMRLLNLIANQPVGIPSAHFEHLLPQS